MRITDEDLEFAYLKASVRIQGDVISFSIVEGSVWMEPLHRAQRVLIGEQKCSINLGVMLNLMPSFMLKADYEREEVPGHLGVSMLEFHLSCGNMHQQRLRRAH